MLCTVLSEKGSALGWSQSMSDMPLYNMKPMYTGSLLKEDFTESLFVALSISFQSLF